MVYLYEYRFVGSCFYYQDYIIGRGWDIRGIVVDFVICIWFNKVINEIVCLNGRFVEERIYVDKYFDFLNRGNEGY